RGLRPAPSAVKQFAAARGLDVYQPSTLKDESALDRVARARPDALVVAAYGLILPPPALGMAPHGALNIHASLLPRWRGAAPIQHALLAGDATTGVSLMRMDEGLDTGPVYAARETPIGAAETAADLHDRLAELGASLLLES